MQNLVYKVEIPMYDEVPPATSTTPQSHSDACAACGENLFGHQADDTSWQTWGALWEISGVSIVELVCSAYGEYLKKIYNNRNESKFAL